MIDEFAQMRKSRIEPSTADGASPYRNSVDTALLLEDLKRKYRAAGRAIPVTFRELASWVRAGDQLTHQIHPYPAKLLPHIANFFIRSSSLCKVGQTVLDPFCGSGTVALEASLAGAKPIVADANPFALLVTKVKTTPYEIAELVSTAHALHARIKRLRTADSIPVVNEHLWYSSTTKKELEKILRAVMEIDDPDLRDFFRICFSVVARRLSYADPAVNVPVRLKEKPSFSDTTNEGIRHHLNWLEIVSPAEEFDKVVRINIGRVHAANLAFPKRKEAIVVGQDARKLVNQNLSRRPAASVGLTVTSPPYGSAQKYIRASSLALNWLSLCSPSELAALEGHSIGREHLSSKYRLDSSRGTDTLSKEFRKLVDQIHAKNPTRAAITEMYFHELGDALCEIQRVTTVDGHVVLVLGNNTVSGFNVENDCFVTEIMLELGFSLELALVDRIHSRGLMTARNKNASLIAGETILMFRKQK
jgi:DNA modification methylase